MAAKETHVVRLEAGSNLADSNNIGFAVSKSGGLISPLVSGNLLINGLVETRDIIGGKKIKVVIPRPRIVGGTSAAQAPLKTTNNLLFSQWWDTGIASISWYAKSGGTAGNIYQSSGGNILGTSLTTGLSTASPVGGTPFYDGTNSYFVISDGGTRPYYITTGFVSTQIADVDCPSGAGTSPYIVYMDGALFVAKNNKIHNSEFASITTWPGYSRSKEQYPASITALAKHKNSIVAFAPDSTEFFFNAGYSGTSPLQRQESFSSRIGLAPQYTVYPVHTEFGDQIYFLGSNWHGVAEGSLGLYRINNFKIEKLSNPYIDKILHHYGKRSEEGGSSLSIHPFLYLGHELLLIHCRMQTDSVSIGHTDYADYTLVYDVTENFWSIWTQRTKDASTKSFQLAASADRYSQMFPHAYILRDPIYSGKPTTVNIETGIQVNLRAQGQTTLGTIEALTDEVATSSTRNIDFLVRYPAMDFDSQKMKSISKMYLLGPYGATSSSVPTLNTTIFNSLHRDAGGATVPTAITSAASENAMNTNLSTGRNFVIEQEWTAGTWTQFDGIELHVVEGEN